MKKLFAIVLLAVSFGAFAEASFDQIEMLIQQKNYAAAESGLEGIIQAHPKSAKAFYAMAQAQAGLGNLEKAQKALNIATGLNPTLDFAPEGSVQKLKQAITPQTAKIEAVEEDHFVRNFLISFVLGFVIVGLWMIKSYRQEQTEKEEADREDFKRQMRENQRKQDHMDMLAKMDAERKTAAVNAQPLKTQTPAGTYYKPATAPVTSTPTATVTQTPAPAPTPAPTVVNNHYGSNNDGLLTGILIGDMMNHHHSHDTTRVVEREVIREVPAPRSSSYWDDNGVHEPTPSRSSSWDDDSGSRSSSRSSSWDSDSSSSSSSSSWSSSSNSDSSSSWDSGSSSSSSDSGSSWD